MPRYKQMPMHPDKVEFEPIDQHQRGVLCALLVRSYSELLIADAEHWEPCREEWSQFDAQVFGNPDTIGRCVFVTSVDGEVVGFGSYDPRQKPEVGIVGHNCVIPECRGRGIGKLQIGEILRRFRDMGIRRAVVQTGEQPFFAPARRMYEACGFVETRRLPGGPDPRYGLIEYARGV